MRLWERIRRLQRSLGQRVSQEVSSVITEYLLDVQPGLYKVIAATASGSTDRFIHDPMGIAQHEDNGGDWHWMAKDGLGTVRGVYDDTLVEVYAADRDPYGELIAVTGSNPTPFEYTGEPEDPNGLLHLRARYYDPGLAVFNSLDPVETPNRYAYVGGNPINMVDPTGNAACSSGGYGGFNTIEDLLPVLPAPDVMNIALERTCITPPVQHGGSDGRGNINRVEVTANYFGVTLTRQCTDYSDEESWDGRTSTVLSALLAMKQAGDLTAFDGTEIRIMHRNRPTGDVPAETFGPDENSNYVIEWYPFGFTSRGNYTEQLVVHEFGHVLENRSQRSSEFSMQQVASSEWLVVGNSDYLRPYSGGGVYGWLPDPQDIGNPEYVRGSYGGSVDFKEALADYFVFWVYGLDKSVKPSPAEDNYMLAETFIEGGKFDAGNSEEYRSPGIARWLQLTNI